MGGERIYQVDRPIGRGGFGTVYKARLRGKGDFSKLVALKVLNPDMEGIDEIAARMRDEARILGLVRHRAIVHVDGLVMLRGRWTIVMELVEGIDLKQAITTHHGVPVGPALEIVGEVAGALNAAWNSPGADGRPLHLLHRDVKPGNIRITPLGEVKLMDFGISRANFDARESHTRSLFFGSPNYMSPERLDQIEDPAGDVYSLGVVLYEMLVGEAFGKASSNVARQRAITSSAITRLAEVVGAEQETLVDFVERLLSHDPQDRPTARQVERRCAELRGHWSHELLRDWAEEVVPALMTEQPEIPGDDFTGSALLDGDGRPGELASTPPERTAGASSGGTQHAAAQADPADPTRWVRLSVDGQPVEPATPAPTPPGEKHAAGTDAKAMRSDTAPPPPDQPFTDTEMDRREWASVNRNRSAAVLVGLLALLAMIGVWYGRDELGLVPGDEVIEVAPEPEPQKIDDGGNEPKIDDKPGEPIEPVEPTAPPQPVVKAVKHEEPPAEPEPKPEPVVQAPAGAHVQLTGNVEKVELKSEAGSWTLPGDVPEGSYDIVGTFPRGTFAAGKAYLLAGTPVTIECWKETARCSQK